MTLESVFPAYLECALWASTTGDDAGTPLDRDYSTDDIAPEALEAMRAEVADFLGYCEREKIDLSTLEPAQVGHDFWLTRNGHGAGFWDRGLGELGDRLTAAAHSFGSSDLYVADDGRIYTA